MAKNLHVILLLIMAVMVSPSLAQSNRFTDPFDYPSPIDLLAMKTDAPVTIPVTSSMPSLAEMQYYINYVTIVYGKYDTTTTNWDCAACGNNVTLVKVIMNRLANTLALVNINQEKQEVVVTFRGSVNLANYVLNGELIPVRTHFTGDNDFKIKVHGGFLVMMNSLYGEIEATLQDLIQQYPGYRLVFVGHSLGGPLAVLTALKIRGNTALGGLDIAIFSFGSPRIGNKDFVDYVNSRNVTIVRVVNQADLASHIPARFIQSVYIHSSNEVWIMNDSEGSVKICSTDVYEDPDCSNSLGPKYNIQDHTTGYFGTNFVSSVTDNWCPFLLQIIINIPPVFSIQSCNL